MCIIQMETERRLTGLTHNYVIGNGLSVFVLGGALVDPLEALGPSLADVHLQGARVGPHDNIGVLLNLKVGPVYRPGETEGQEKAEHDTVWHITKVVDSIYCEF